MQVSRVWLQHGSQALPGDPQCSPAAPPQTCACRDMRSLSSQLCCKDGSISKPWAWAHTLTPSSLHHFPLGAASSPPPHSFLFLCPCSVTDLSSSHESHRPKPPLTNKQQRGSGFPTHMKKPTQKESLSDPQHRTPSSPRLKHCFTILAGIRLRSGLTRVLV